MEQKVLVNRATSGLENATRPTKTSSPCRDEDTGVGTISFLVFNLYKRRWIMLAALSLVVFSNAMLLVSFATITYRVAEYYNVTYFKVNVLLLLDAICAIPCGFAAAWLLHTKGLGFVMLLGAYLSGGGGLVRAVSILGSQPSYSVLFTGQLMAAAAVPFLLCCPTALASIWFGDQERATANLASIAHPFGIAVANLVSPSLATEKDGIAAQIWLYSGLAMVAAFLLTLLLAFINSKPPSPPSPCARIENKEKYTEELKEMCKIGSYWNLLLTWAAASGVSSSLQTLVDVVMCPEGISNKFTGICGAIITFLGIPGAAISTIFVDKTRRFNIMAKACFLGHSLFAIAFATMLTTRNSEILVAFSLGLLTSSAMILMPVSFELGVETSFPLSEATNSAVLWTTRQTVSLVFFFIGQIPPFTHKNDIPLNFTYSGTCTTFAPHNETVYFHEAPPADITNGVWLQVGVICFTTFIFILKFNTNYRRIEKEKAIIEASVCTTYEDTSVTDNDIVYNGSNITLPFASINM